jgi:choline-glycine betaine transporter
MKKVNNWYLIGGVVYIVFWLGMIISDIGEVQCSNEPITYGVALTMLGFTLVPFMLGYCAGKFEED